MMIDRSRAEGFATDWIAAWNSHDKLKSVLWGVNSLVIHYQRHDGRDASEWFEFGGEDKVTKSCAHYAGE